MADLHVLPQNAMDDPKTPEIPLSPLDEIIVGKGCKSIILQLLHAHHDGPVEVLKGIDVQSTDDLVHGGDVHGGISRSWRA